MPIVMLAPLALVLAAAPQDREVNCEEAWTQNDLNYCAHQDYMEADAALNAQWSLTAEEMRRMDRETEEDRMEWDDRPGYFDSLLEGQRAWLGYRDAHCRSEGYWARGGSMEPMLVSGCLAALTRMRTEQLRELAIYPD